MLEFKNVSKIYPDQTQALKKVSLTVPKGQFCILLGPSGAGKTTLLKMANFLVPPSQGVVSINGTDITKKNLRKLRPSVAMIHQHFNLVPRLSVEKNIISGALPSLALWRVLLHVFPEGLRKKACELTASVGLQEKHFSRKASELSGGQQQRVGIARAFVMDPLVVLADEPVASLDPKISRDVLNILRKSAQERNTTVLCSLHQVDLAREFGDRIVGMHDGEVVFDDIPEKLDEKSIEKIYEKKAQNYSMMQDEMDRTIESLEDKQEYAVI
jgi:phosphonate transport system ATP-binding protein